jgi:tRNA threonylcarbamoyladenosine modification (KEOPS) complex Cgi121 subunit
MVFEIIHHAKDFDKFIGIAGFSDFQVENIDAFLREVEKKLPKAVFQFLNAKFIAGPRHLIFAAINALNAFKTGFNISRSLPVECLLYASAQNQINRALALIGVHPTTTEVALLVIGKEEKTARELLEIISEFAPGTRDDSVLELSDVKSPEIKVLFGISEAELSTRNNEDEKISLTELVIEHCALLVCNR